MLQPLPRILQSGGLEEIFTSEKWENLVSLPSAVLMAIMVAAPTIWEYTKAIMQEPARMAAESGSSLIGLFLDKTLPRIKDRMKKQQDTWNHDHAGEQGKTLVACRSAVEALGRSLLRRHVDIQPGSSQSARRRLMR